MFSMIGKLFGFLFRAIGWLWDHLAEAIYALGDWLTPVRHAVVRFTGRCVSAVGHPLMDLAANIEELEALGFLLYLVLAVVCALLAVPLLRAAYRKCPPDEDPSAFIAIKTVIIGLGAAWLAYSLGDHSAAEGIMSSLQGDFAGLAAVDCFEKWFPLLQFDLWFIVLTILPVALTDCIFKFRWTVLPAMLLGATAGLAFGRALYLAVSFLHSMFPLVSILLYPLEGISFVTIIPLLFALIPYQLLDDAEGIAKGHRKRSEEQQAVLEARERAARRAAQSARPAAGSFEHFAMSHTVSSIPDTIHGPNGQLYHKVHTMERHAIFRSDAGQSVQINDAHIGYSGRDASNTFGYFYW